MKLTNEQRLAILADIMDSVSAGVPTLGLITPRMLMSKGIDTETGTINVHELLPNLGDSLMIVNCGDHYEMRESRFEIVPEIALTEEEILHLQAGSVTWH